MTKELVLMELSDSIPLMLSDNYKDRIAAEFAQLEIRTRKLKDYIERINRGECVPDCKMSTLYMQLAYMLAYAGALEARVGEIGGLCKRDKG